MRVRAWVCALIGACAAARNADANGASDLATEGRTALLSGDEHRAVRLFTEAITLDPSLGSAYVELAQARMKLGDAREAERVLTTGMVHAPNHDALFESRARARRALGWHSDAVVDMHEYAARLGTVSVWERYAEFCGEGGQFPAQLGAWRRLALFGEEMKHLELQEKARRLSHALQLLVDIADPVIAPNLPDPSRQAMASLAKKRAQSIAAAGAPPGGTTAPSSPKGGRAKSGK